MQIFVQQIHHQEKYVKTSYIMINPSLQDNSQGVIFPRKFGFQPSSTAPGSWWTSVLNSSWCRTGKVHRWSPGVYLVHTISAHTHTHMLHTHMCIYTHTHIHIHIYIYIHTSIYTYMYCAMNPYICFGACTESCVFLLVFAVLGDIRVLMGWTCADDTGTCQNPVNRRSARFPVIAHIQQNPCVLAYPRIVWSSLGHFFTSQRGVASGRQHRSAFGHREKPCQGGSLAAKESLLCIFLDPQLWHIPGNGKTEQLVLGPSVLDGITTCGTCKKRILPDGVCFVMSPVPSNSGRQPP